VAFESSSKTNRIVSRSGSLLILGVVAVFAAPAVLAQRTGGRDVPDGAVSRQSTTAVQNRGAERRADPAAAAVPHVVKDINPGQASSTPQMFVRFGRSVFFRANDGEHGVELWRTDGTSGGTTLVIDLFQGSSNGLPGNLRVAGGSLYFHGFTEPTGSKVFRSNGTRAGTQLLVDTFPGAADGPFGPPLPGEFTTLGSNVLFAATDAKLGYELWITDGSPAGTHLLKDIHPGEQWSVPADLIPFRDRVYFAADDSSITNPDGTVTFDRELFVTDGTEAGTGRLIDINRGPQPSIPILFTPFGRQLLFRADDGAHGTELWTSDGTAIGTEMLADINLGGASQPMQLTAIDHRVFFAANDGATGAEPWITDGTPAGTQLVDDVNPAGSSTPMHFTALNDRVVFVADDGQHGNEPWVTDGTQQGTHLIADINPGPASSSPLGFVRAGGALFFAVVVDADAVTRTVRTQLWRTDGTSQGTTLVWDAPGRFTGYSIQSLTLLENELLFSAPVAVDAAGLSTNFELYALPVRN
jgi:ELWxxDGT repeat protein